MNPTLTALRGRGAAAVALLAVASVAYAQDPFEPGLRWTHEADASLPWIPRSVCFGAYDNLVWASSEHGTPQLMVLSTHGEGPGNPNPPLFVDLDVSAAFPVLRTAAGVDVDSLYAVAQYPSPDQWHRRTEVSRYDVTAASSGDLDPVWVHDTGVVGNGPALLATDRLGRRVAVAVWDSENQIVDLDWLAGDDGALLFEYSFPAEALNQIAMSADGSFMAISAGTTLHVFEAGAGEVHDYELPTATRALSISGDGNMVLVGANSSVLVFLRRASGFLPPVTVRGRLGELPVFTDLSYAGETYAVSWWRPGSEPSVRFEVRDGRTHDRLYQSIQTSVAGSPQNLPAALDVSENGRRVAFGVWGDGSSAPELVVYDRVLEQHVFELDLPGSVQDVRFDLSGTRLAVGYKDTHANDFGNTGGIRLYDTGERILQIARQPHLGQNLDLVFQHPLAQSATFLIGSRLRSEPSLPGESLGGFLLERSRRLIIASRTVDENGRARLSLPIPDDPAFFGMLLSAQVAYRLPDGTLKFSPAVDPLIF